ncbi:hypothetical protein NC99_08120 [Sunxiuqinia dokdonensis]|uniref:Uncharacterized protein n=1 Tax=Sunxiuqinia dokdonensis TaxID=1409788 RepID=A0A0L8VD59_9BACT|nr:hypothetical protein NC99_08120 [Sunxiuqinia dokdonensis]
MRAAFFVPGRRQWAGLFIFDLQIESHATSANKNQPSTV